MTRLSVVDIYALRPQRIPLPPCSPELRARLQSLGIWVLRASPAASPGTARPGNHRRRQCRAGRRVQLRKTVNTPMVLVSKLPTEIPELSFSCLNVRSLHNKTDDVLEIICDRHVDVFCLTETLHDSDSACISRLRTSGFNVIDRGRDDLSTNHGGVAIISSGSISMSPVAVMPATTFEHVAVCMVLRQFTCIVVTLYRPGSAKVAVCMVSPNNSSKSLRRSWNR